MGGIILNEIYDVIIIGAGQAGIVMSYELKQKNINHLMIDSSTRIGDSWRNRHNSLILLLLKDIVHYLGWRWEGTLKTFQQKMKWEII